MTFKRAIAPMFLLLASMAVAAQQPAALEIKTVVQKHEIVVAENGEQEARLVPAETVFPGDEVVYTLAFENTGVEPADNVVITNPLPAELTYVEGSANGSDAVVQFSVDGGRSYATAEELIIEDSDGRRDAEPSDFTHIRWVIGVALMPGEVGLAQFRARLN